MVFGGIFAFMDVAEDVVVGESVLVLGHAFEDHLAAEHQAESVGDDGGAARRETAGGDEFDDVGEDGVDAFGRGVVACVVGQDFGGKVFGVVELKFAGESGVAETEADGGILDGKTAAALVASAVRTASGSAASRFGFGG